MCHVSPDTPSWNVFPGVKGDFFFGGTRVVCDPVGSADVQKARMDGQRLPTQQTPHI